MKKEGSCILKICLVCTHTSLAIAFRFANFVVYLSISTENRIKTLHTVRFEKIDHVHFLQTIPIPSGLCSV